MLRLLYLMTTLYVSCLADPKAPRIYNVLISSKKNLSPSQALPVYEPVVRTTSLGYVYSPLTIYNTLGHPYRVIPQYTLSTFPQYERPQENPVDQSYIGQKPLESKNSIQLPEKPILPPAENKDLEENKDPGTKPLPYEQFVPYYNPLLANYGPQVYGSQVLKQPLGDLHFQEVNDNKGTTVAPKKEQQEKFSIPRPENFPNLAQDQSDPKHVVANLRQKSDIPDVPPPPLPVRNKS